MSSAADSGPDSSTAQETPNDATPTLSGPVSLQMPPAGNYSEPLFTTSDPDSPFASISPIPTPRAPETPIFVDPMDIAPTEPPPVPSGVKRVELVPTGEVERKEEEIGREEVVVAETPVQTVPTTNLLNAPAPGMQSVSFTARKKGGTVKNWKSRYWLFEPTGGMLSYYEDKDRKHKKGYIDLSCCTGMGPIRHDREMYALGLRTKDRLWVLAFDSMDELGRIQTLLGSVVQGDLEVKDVPISALGKLKRGFGSKKSKSSQNGGRNTSPDKKSSKSSQSTSGNLSSSSPPSSMQMSTQSTSTVTATSNSQSSASSSSFSTTSSSSSYSYSSSYANNTSSNATSTGSSSNGTFIVSHSDGFRSSSAESANANEKTGLAKLNQNLNRIKEYTGKEFTLECDMSVVRARLESDHPEWKDRPGDVIYDGFMTALANKIQELCEYPLYRDIINHKIHGRIAVRISDDPKDLISNTPFSKLDQGMLIIICHRSLLTSNLFDLGDDILDVLSIGEPLHICTIKDIEDHKQGIKSCLIKIQAQLGVTCQFECDYTEGFKILQSVDPSAANTYKQCWGEVIYKYLEMATSHILKMASDTNLKANFIASVPNKAIRVTITPSDELFRSAWSNTDGGTFNILINASKFMPEFPIAF